VGINFTEATYILDFQFQFGQAGERQHFVTGFASKFPKPVSKFSTSPAVKISNCHSNYRISKTAIGVLKIEHPTKLPPNNSHIPPLTSPNSDLILSS
jgi:hypothetical protein